MSYGSRQWGDSRPSWTEHPRRCDILGFWGYPCAVECELGGGARLDLGGGSMRPQTWIAGLFAFLAVLVGSERVSRAVSIDPVAQLRTVHVDASAAEPPGPLYTDSSSRSAADFAASPPMSH